MAGGGEGAGLRMHDLSGWATGLADLATWNGKIFSAILGPHPARPGRRRPRGRRLLMSSPRLKAGIPVAEARSRA